MAILFAPPFYRATDNLNAPIPGAFIGFYATQTSTLQPIYADAGLTIALQNPVQADGDGNFPAIWLDDSLPAYKYVIYAPDDQNPAIAGDVIRSGDPYNTSKVAFPQTAAEIAAGIIPANPDYPAYDIRRYGASKGSSNAVNKVALQTAISVVSAQGAASGGVIIVPGEISYGYKITDLTTYPSFTGVAAPVTVIDYGPGNSYAGFPTAYDGNQVRYFLYTPQTTSPGQHDGNGLKVNGAWAPYLAIDNVANLPNPSVGAFDNRRGNLYYFNDGVATWSVGQGTLAGVGLTPDQLSNFAIQCYGSGIGNYVPYLVERATGNVSYGGGTNVPAASHHFKSVIVGYLQGIFESLTTTSQISLRTSNGATDDAGLVNRVGQLCLNISTQGDAIAINKADRRVLISQAIQVKRTAVTYSASITPDASAANEFDITATNGTAFTINAPSNPPSDSQRITITIRNTSGGVLGAVTWNGIFKLAAWTQPLNGFSRSIDYRFDQTNWVEVSRTPADVPN